MSSAEEVRRLALSLVGAEYSLGNEAWYDVGYEPSGDPTAVDCSGLIYSVFRRAKVLVDGKPLTRETADTYYHRATPIKAAEARCGDLGFLMNNAGHVYHTFLVVGPGVGYAAKVVEAGDGTGHVGLRTVAVENNRHGIHWGRLNTDITEGAEDMTDDERKLLKQCRVSGVSNSWDAKILKAMIAGAKPEEIAKLEAAKAADLASVRASLGL